MTRNARLPRGWKIAPLAVVLLVLSACSSAKSSSGSGSAGTPAGAVSSGTGSASAATARVSTATGSLGTYLVGDNGTLYLWMADASGSSTCYDQCATHWPPLTTHGSPAAGSGVDAAKLGTTTRKDGSMQVTYNGHPLYYFAGDTKPGDTAGQGVNGFGARWYVVGTDGNPIEKAASSSSGYGY